jgi:putative FmdB family regulatory protein
MPIYEYSCQKCQVRIEVMQKITDKPLKRCTSCGGKLEKEWSTSSFQLKGSGWYVTDYAAKKSGAADKESATPATKSEGATETKSAEGAAETKTAKETSTEVAGTEGTKPKKTSQPATTSKPTKSD